jgi:hypothetical protein
VDGIQSFAPAGMLPRSFFAHSCKHINDQGGSIRPQDEFCLTGRRSARRWFAADSAQPAKIASASNNIVRSNLMSGPQYADLC